MTPAKRVSAYSFLGSDRVLPIPDGSVDVGDRAHLADAYAGIAVSAPGGGDGSSVLFIRRPSTPRLVVDEDEDELSLILSLAVARRT